MLWTHHIMPTSATHAATELETPSESPEGTAERAFDDDAEWLEFLSLGQVVSRSGQLASQHWRRAPVLLSF